MQYCGGFGFVMIMVMLVYGKQSMDLSGDKGHLDKLTPNLKKTAQIFSVCTARFSQRVQRHMPLLVCHCSTVSATLCIPFPPANFPPALSV